MADIYEVLNNGVYRPGSHRQCPQCNTPALWIPRHEKFAKCFRCEAFFKPTEVSPGSWQNVFMQAVRDAFVKAFPCSVAEKYCLARGAHPAVLRALELGSSVPSFKVNQAVELATARIHEEQQEQATKPQPEDDIEYDAEGQLRILKAKAEQLKTLCDAYPNFLVFFYQDGEGGFIGANFRKPIMTQEPSEKIVRRFQMNSVVRGVFGGHYADPGTNETLAALADVTYQLMVFEGEFNPIAWLSMLSRLAESEGDSVNSYWNRACAVGSVSGADMQTVLHMDDYPLICYDCDRKPDPYSPSPGEKLVEALRKVGYGEAFSTPSLPSDMDSYIRQRQNYGGDKKAWEGISKAILGRTKVTKDIDVVRQEIDEIIRESDCPAHFRDRKIVNLLWNDLQKRGKVFVDGYAYAWLPEDRTLIRCEKDSADWDVLFTKYGFLKDTTLQNLAASNLELKILTEGRKDIEVHAMSYSTEQAVYLNMGAHRMVRITRDTIEVVPLGTDDVYFSDATLDAHGYLWPAPEPALLEQARKHTKGYGLFSFDSSAWGRQFTANWAHGDGLSKRDYLLLFHARILMTFFRDWFNAAPILEATGEQLSGKTLTFEKIGWLLYGPKYESSNLPKDKRSFTAAVTNSALCIFDEAEGFNFEKHEIMGLINKIPFGGYEEMAVLYMNNVIRKLKLRSHVAFIGRDLLFDSRSDTMRRTLVLPFLPFPSSKLDRKSVKDSFFADYPALYHETLVRIQRTLIALQETKGKAHQCHSGNIEFEQFMRRVADYEGWPKVCDGIWKNYQAKYTDAAAANNPVVTLCSLWLGHPGNAERAKEGVSVASLYKEVKEMFANRGIKMYFKSDMGLAKALAASSNATALATLGHGSRTLNGRNLHVFEPSDSVLARCASRARELRVAGETLHPEPELEDVA